MEVLSLPICTYFAIFGYSQIPELLISPSLYHIFKKNILENSKSNIERAKSNISFQYTCRGIPTPETQKKKLKVIEKQLENVQEEITKLEKKGLNNHFYQWIMISIGIFLVCAWFWVLAILIGILVEGVIMSECGWMCGFYNDSKIRKLFTDFKTILNILVGLVYLILIEIGYFLALDTKTKDNSTNLFLGAIFLTSLTANAIPTILNYYCPKDFNSSVPIISFIFHTILCSGTFIYFAYWNFFKCKNR